jgi:hypothetical protein
LVLLGLPVSAHAQRTEHVVDWLPRAFAVRGTVDLDVRAVGGKIHIQAGPEGKVTVSGTIHTIGRDPEAARVASRGSKIAATAEGDHVLVVETDRGTTTFELSIEVPRSRVRMRGRGAVELDRLGGPVDVETKAGNVTAALAGPASLRLDTDKGRVDQDLGLRVVDQQQGNHADGRVGTGGPDIVLRTHAGNIAVRQVR